MSRFHCFGVCFCLYVLVVVRSDHHDNTTNESKISVTMSGCLLYSAEPDKSASLSWPSKTMVSYLPDICAVVEVTTENEESAVSSTQIPYNLQISPMTCYTGTFRPHTPTVRVYRLRDTPFQVFNS